MSAKLDVKDVRDAPTLAMLRDAYCPGTKIEAVKVKNKPQGMAGIVREVNASGEIVVLWANGEIGEVEFGIDSVRIVNGSKCMVKRKPDDQACAGDKCSECGWNDEVYKERLERIRNGEMVAFKTEHGYGTRLIVRRSSKKSAEELLNSTC